MDDAVKSARHRPQFRPGTPGQTTAHVVGVPDQRDGHEYQRKHRMRLKGRWAKGKHIIWRHKDEPDQKWDHQRVAELQPCTPVGQAVDDRALYHNRSLSTRASLVMSRTGSCRRRRWQDREQLCKFHHVFCFHPSVLALGPNHAVAAQFAVCYHPAHRRF